MGQARRLLSLSLAVVLTGGALVGSGCGSGEETTQSSPGGSGTRTSTAPAGSRIAVCKGAVAGVGRVRASGTGCAVALGLVASWDNKRACGAPASGSRVSCSVADYRCLGVATERGLAVTCAHPGASIAFLAKRG